MNILADENIEGLIIAWLRERGHDVESVSEKMRGKPDILLAEYALEQGRIVLTRDLDFGDIVVVNNKQVPGVVLLRNFAPTAEERRDQFCDVWPTIEQNVQGNFIVVSQNRIRCRKI